MLFILTDASFFSLSGRSQSSLFTVLLIGIAIHSSKLSMTMILIFYCSVVQGVKLYKEGKQMEAMSCYNKALDIDPDNVEALVARGAM